MSLLRSLSSGGSRHLLQATLCRLLTSERPRVDGHGARRAGGLHVHRHTSHLHYSVFRHRAHPSPARINNQLAKFACYMFLMPLGCLDKWYDEIDEYGVDR